MAKCWTTNVEIPLNEAFVLDASEARRAIRDMEMTIRKITNLLEQYCVTDEVEIFDKKAGEKRKVKQHRLVCEAAAEMLGQVAPQYRLFVPRNQFLSDRKSFRRPQGAAWGAAANHETHSPSAPNPAQEVNHEAESSPDHQRATNSDQS